MNPRDARSGSPPAGGETTPRRPIRSFTRRAGRLTSAQQRALTELWPRYGLEPGGTPLDFRAIFGREAPRICEIGFGNGDALCSLAGAEPSSDFVGIEVHEPGLGHCLLAIARLEATNVRLMRGDASELLARAVPAGSFDRVNLYFPDPWPKKRHHKRRLVQPGFATLLARVLKPGGIFHVATDWPPYAEHIAAVLAAHHEFAPAPLVSDRARTRFETRGERLGHTIWEACYRRI